jgi:hypothetical protein
MPSAQRPLIDEIGQAMHGAGDPARFHILVARLRERTRDSRPMS